MVELHPHPHPQLSWANSTKFSILFKCPENNSGEVSWWLGYPHPTPAVELGQLKQIFKYLQNVLKIILVQFCDGWVTPPTSTHCWVGPTQPNYHIFPKCPQNYFGAVLRWLSNPPPTSTYCWVGPTPNFSKMSSNDFGEVLRWLSNPSPPPTVEFGLTNKIFKFFQNVLEMILVKFRDRWVTPYLHPQLSWANLPNFQIFLKCPQMNLVKFCDGWVTSRTTTHCWVGPTQPNNQIFQNVLKKILVKFWDHWVAPYLHPQLSWAN